MQAVWGEKRFKCDCLTQTLYSHCGFLLTPCFTTALVSNLFPNIRIEISQSVILFLLFIIVDVLILGSQLKQTLGGLCGSVGFLSKEKCGSLASSVETEWSGSDSYRLNRFDQDSFIHFLPGNSLVCALPGLTGASSETCTSEPLPRRNQGYFSGPCHELGLAQMRLCIKGCFSRFFISLLGNKWRWVLLSL